MKLICSTHRPSPENDFFPTSWILSSYNAQRSSDYKLTVLLLEKPISLIQTDWQQILVHNREVPRTTTWYWPWLECSLQCSSTHRAITSSCWDEQWRTPYPTKKGASHLLEETMHQYVIFSCVVGMNISSLTHIIDFWNEWPWALLLTAFWDEKSILRSSNLNCLMLCPVKSSFYKGNGLRPTWWALSGEDY